LADRKKLETALLGKRAQFQCNVQSPNAAELTIWWQFQNKNLTKSPNDQHHSITVSKSASGSVASELTLATVTWADEGIYSCVAKEVGSTDEPTMQEIILEIYGMKLSLLNIAAKFDFNAHFQADFFFFFFKFKKSF
jgi:hypothetical protein